MKKEQKTLGFTLAEVLITLGIIGIVAAMTIPTLMNNTQNNEFKSAWKKEYSQLAIATSLIAQDNGGSLKGYFDLNNDGNVYLVDNDNNLLRDKYAEKMKIIKTCSATVDTQNCFPITTIKILSGANYSSWWPVGSTLARFSGLILNDGTLITFDNLSADCSHSWSPKGTCGFIQVDVNGFKQPNTIGKDIFGLFILGDGSTAPFGSMGDVFQTNATGYVHDCNQSLSNTSGWSCSADYLKQ